MTSPRTNEAVWFEKHRRWQIKVQKNGIRKTFSSSTPGRTGKLECHRAADEWFAAGAPVETTIRVRELYERMLEHLRVDTGTGNYVNLESFGRNWILPSIGSRKVSSLTLDDLQHILDRAAAAGKSRKTIHNIRGAISAMLKHARRSGLTSLIASDLVIPRNAKKTSRGILTLEQIKTLFTVDTTHARGAVVPEWYINAFRLFVAVGLRPGELCELQTTKQHEDTAITVHGNYNRFGEHTEGKTENAQRVIPLPEYGEKVMEEQRAMLRREGIISPYLFPKPDGTQTTEQLLYRHWKAYQRANGIEPALSLYELRHTYASLCRHSGVPEEWMKSVMGHSYNMPTYGVYGHSYGDEAVNVARILDENIHTFIGEKPL